ncbi:MAG: hypothetical protein ACPGXK_03375 [Phycisphaerae bacterium]
MNAKNAAAHIICFRFSKLFALHWLSDLAQQRDCQCVMMRGSASRLTALANASVTSNLEGHGNGNAFLLDLVESGQ